MVLVKDKDRVERMCDGRTEDKGWVWISGHRSV